VPAQHLTKIKVRYKDVPLTENSVKKQHDGFLGLAIQDGLRTFPQSKSSIPARITYFDLKSTANRPGHYPTIATRQRCVVIWQISLAKSNQSCFNRARASSI
jgi:uncharacterized protein YjiK